MQTLQHIIKTDLNNKTEVIIFFYLYINVINAKMQLAFRQNSNTLSHFILLLCSTDKTITRKNMHSKVQTNI